MTLHERKKSESLSPLKGGLPVPVEALLVWAYRDQRAAEMAADYAPGPGGVVSQLGAFSALGSRVSSSGSRAGSGRLHDDALTLHEAVIACGRRAAALVMVHARLATRPDARIEARWRMAPETWRLVERYPGTGEFLRVPEKGWIRRPTPAGGASWWDRTAVGTGEIIYVKQVDAPDEVRRDREAWTMWRGALRNVRAMVAGKMTAHAVSDELPPERPWAEVGAGA